MVNEWSPDPSKCLDTTFSSRNNTIFIDGHESDDNSDSSIYSGYELLPHDPSHLNLVLESFDGSSDASDSDESDDTVNSPSSHDSFGKPFSPNETTRPDIQINQDEVRQIMANITLPTSAFPPWANNVPESQWTSYLVSRIKNMQNENNAK